VAPLLSKTHAQRAVLFAPPRGHNIANNFDNLIRLREIFERILPIPLDDENPTWNGPYKESSVSWSCRFLLETFDAFSA